MQLVDRLRPIVAMLAVLAISAPVARARTSTIIPPRRRAEYSMAA